MSNGDLYQWCYDGINSEWFLQVNNSAMDDITSPETFEADLKTAVGEIDGIEEIDDLESITVELRSPDIRSVIDVFGIDIDRVLCATDFVYMYDFSRSGAVARRHVDQIRKNIDALFFSYGRQERRFRYLQLPMPPRDPGSAYLRGASDDQHREFFVSMDELGQWLREEFVVPPTVLLEIRSNEDLFGTPEQAAHAEAAMETIRNDSPIGLLVNFETLSNAEAVANMMPEQYLHKTKLTNHKCESDPPHR